MKKKILMALTITLCAVMLVVGSVAGTMAYLRATAEVVNTFTYGKVGITMDETLIGEDGLKPSLANQRATGNRYKLMPGTTYVKDPVIHIGAESEDMYLFIKVDNGIAGLATDGTIVDENGVPYKTIQQQLLENGWKVYKNEASKEYTTTTNTTTNAGVVITSTSTVYYLSVGEDEASVDAKIVTKDSGSIPTFETFTTGKTNVTEASMTAHVNNNAKIGILAYAVQKSGFTSYHEAAEVFTTEWASAIPADPAA